MEPWLGFPFGKAGTKATEGALPGLPRVSVVGLGEVGICGCEHQPHTVTVAFPGWLKKSEECPRLPVLSVLCDSTRTFCVGKPVPVCFPGFVVLLFFFSLNPHLRMYTY